MSQSRSFRLPTSVRPKKYWIRLEPNLDQFRFSGEETIDVEVLRPVAKIVLNAAELEIQSAELTKDGELIPVKDMCLDEKREFATLTFAKRLTRGAATLRISFTGILNDKLRGFYRSRETLEDGTVINIATTQFEAADARRAFPCWDEPEIKARFEVTLRIPKGLTAISNTPIVAKTQTNTETEMIRFAETPLMSTYLLVFVIGKFERVIGTTRDGVRVSVWAVPGKEKHGRFALDCAIKFLEFFTDYFGIPYPLEKLDLLAIPDFAAGAMENWGAITYREVALLVDEENSPVSMKQRVAVIVAHEEAHQWFGNLVTMKWWNDLWLNEGFASWMEYKAVDHVFPEWDMWTQFVSVNMNSALRLDGLKTSHPIEVNIQKPGDIKEQFDAISYSKGASVIRMLETFLGSDVFREGLRIYLTRHKYSNTETDDLWHALEKVSGKPVKRIMDTWTKQMGYPVVHAESRPRKNGIELKLSQSRFLYEGVEQESGDDSSLWQVPISIGAPSLPKPIHHLLGSRECIIHVKRSVPQGPEDWIKLNASQTGFFRVGYTAQDLKKLSCAIGKQELSAVDRLGVQNDVWALVRAGTLPAREFLKLLPAYTSERDYAVWADLSASLAEMTQLSFEEPYYGCLEERARDLFRPIANAMGWEARDGEGHLDALLRGLVIGQLGSYGEETVLTEAKSRFRLFLENPTGLDPNLKTVVYNLAARRGDKSMFETFRRLARDAKLQEEQKRFQRALTQFEDPMLLKNALEISLSDEVRAQDAPYIIAWVALNPHGRALAWEFVKANWPELNRRYGEGGSMLMGMLSSATRNFQTPAREEEVREFFEKYPVPAATRTIQQSLENIRMNIRFVEQSRADLVEWFTKRKNTK